MNYGKSTLQVMNAVLFEILGQPIIHELQNSEFLSVRTFFLENQVTCLPHFELPIMLNV